MPLVNETANVSGFLLNLSLNGYGYASNAIDQIGCSIVTDYLGGDRLDWKALKLLPIMAGGNLGGLTRLSARGNGFLASKSTFFIGRQSLGAAASDVRTGLKGLLKDKGLPTRGKIRFVPEKKALNTGIRVQDGGFVDRFGNVWRRPRGQIVREPHWDVQLSRTGRQDLGWASRSGNHVNVSLDGRIVH